MNIVLVAIDTLSARHMGCYGYQRETTPFMDEYAKGGALFENCYCQAIPTQPSYTSMYTGQYVITHRIVSHGGTRDLSESAPFLPEIMGRHGYTTCAVDNLYRMKGWFARGYEFYITPRMRVQYPQGEPCEFYNQRAIPWLKSLHQEKFFLFVHYWDPHTPYFPPPEYRPLFYAGNPTDPKNISLEGLWKHPFGESWKKWFDQLQPNITDAEYITAMYDSEIRYADDGLKNLLATLEEVGVADDTLVVIFSDHGEIMHRHKIYFDHHGLYDEDIHVPLIIRLPGKGGRRIPHLVQHIDIAPTILDAAGIEIPGEMEGSSLIPYLTGRRDEPIYPYLVTEECTRLMKWALRTKEYKYILSKGPDYRKYPPEELYDLRKDPGEENNIVADEPATATELKGILEGWVRKMMEKNGLKEDPLVANGLTLAADWEKWVTKHGYW